MIFSSDTCKIKLTIAICFVSSNNTEEEREMYSTSDNIKFFIKVNKVNEVVNEIFESLLARNQTNLEVSVRGSEFIFNPLQFFILNAIK